jgi:fibronectin-binding autotransporter adhesin
MSRQILKSRSSLSRSRLIAAVVASVTTMTVGPFVATAQTTYTGANNGDWATGGNWSAGVPAIGTNAQINNNASAVNVNLAASTTGNVNNLTIDAGDSLTLLNNSTLNIAGNLIANGTLRFNVAANESFLNFGSATSTLTGLIDFNYQGTAAAGVIQGPSTGTITSTGTIRGSGSFRNIRFTNAAGGVIESYQLSTTAGVYIDPNAGGAGLFVNQGTIRSLAGCLTVFTGDFGGDVNSTGGNIQANGAGAIVRFFNNASVTGGNYSTTGGGEIQVQAGQTAFASPQSLSGTFRVNNGSTLNLGGNMANNGSIRLTTAGSASTLTVNGPLSLSGTGSLVGEWSGTGAGPLIGTTSTNVMTIGANQTQSGVLYYNNVRVTNNGLIDANVASAATTGSGIIIDPNNQAAGLFVNNGTMRSSGGGLLSITGDFGGDTVNNGTISAIGTNSITELYNNAAVTGGTWTNSGGGVLRVRPGQTGNLGGPITISSGSTFLVPANNVNGGTTLNVAGTFTGGTIRLDAAGATALLNVAGDTTITSGTTITGTYTNISNSPGPRIDTNANTLTIASGATVNGVVAFNNTRVINNGTVTANNAAGMYVDPSNQGTALLFVNNNIMEATGGGLMQVAGDNGGALVNNGTLRAVGAGSIVELRNSINVIGGTISTSTGGVVRVQPGQTATLTGPATVSAGSSFTVLGNNVNGGATLNVTGSYNFNGSLDLNSAGATALLNVAGDSSFNGTLNGLYTNLGGSPGSRIDTGANTLTIGAAATVQGVVFFNNARVINNGLIDANLNSTTAGIYADASNQAAGLFVNNGTMRSSNGGILQLTGDNGGDFINNGTISAIGAGSVTELVNSVTVTGGTWTNTSGGVIRIRPGQTATLNSPTISAGSTFVVEANSTLGAATLNLNTSLTGPGTLELRANNTTSSPVLNIASNVTLNSGSSVWMSYNTTGVGSRIDTGGNTLTIASGATVRGTGFFNNARVINNGTILADNHVVPDALGNADMYIDASNQGGTLFVNNGTMSASNNARIYLTGDNGGAFGGTGALTVTAGAQIVSWNSAAGDMGPVSGTGTFIAANSANLGFQSFRITNLQAVNSGTARVTAGATPGLAAGTSKVSTITVNTSGKVDLTNNGIVVTGMTPAAVRALVAAGRAGGAWNGANGIGSSLANNNGKAIGYALASELYSAPGTFLGQSFVLTDVVARYTLAGDNTLDGAVNFDDLLKLAANYNVSGSGTWAKGDYNYDGNMNFDDLLLLAANYNTAVTGSLGGDWALAQASVPEPTVVSLGVLTAGLLLGRQRRGSR